MKRMTRAGGQKWRVVSLRPGEGQTGQRAIFTSESTVLRLAQTDIKMRLSSLVSIPLVWKLSVCPAASSPLWFGTVAQELTSSYLDRYGGLN